VPRQKLLMIMVDDKTVSMPSDVDKLYCVKLADEPKTERDRDLINHFLKLQLSE